MTRISSFQDVLGMPGANALQCPLRLPVSSPSEDAQHRHLSAMPMICGSGASNPGSAEHPRVKGSPADPSSSEIFAIGMGVRAGSRGLDKCFNLRPPRPGLRQLKVAECGRVAGRIN